ncbi:unnamed protein product [Nezara viridula]|uniref:Uncharacterized protein n=1 Tax=Nezara viridula TaxID=85310 RepID=A0A9P0HSJ3_NEZVI|nr:unnamed protein product [Nezara viridula]
MGIMVRAHMVQVAGDNLRSSTWRGSHNPVWRKEPSEKEIRTYCGHRGRWITNRSNRDLGWLGPSYDIMYQYILEFFLRERRKLLRLTPPLHSLFLHTPPKISKNVNYRHGEDRDVEEKVEEVKWMWSVEWYLEKSGRCYLCHPSREAINFLRSVLYEQKIFVASRIQKWFITVRNFRKQHVPKLQMNS